jgi:hypothetical protein
MPREKKQPIQLRTVDEDMSAAPPPKVLRLRKTGGIESEQDAVEPMRLGRVQDDDDARLLYVPVRKEVEFRSHEPGIEALIEEVAAAESTEQSWGGNESRGQPVPWGWFALLGLVIAAALVWSLTRVHESQDVAASIREVTKSALLREEEEDNEARDLVVRLESAIAAFFGVRQLGEWRQMVRHPERVMPLILAHYAKHPGLPGPLRSVQSLQPVMIENRGNFWMASVVLASGRKHSMVLEIDRHGSPLVDWETLVCHQPMGWDDFARDRPQGKSMDFRVFVEADNFFSHEFSDARQWMSFRLTALDAEEPMFGYMKLDHADLPKIMQLLEANGNRRTALILRLIIPDALQSRRGVIIEKLVSPRWLYADSPPSDA